jgi:hypothetical protein
MDEVRLITFSIPLFPGWTLDTGQYLQVRMLYSKWGLCWYNFASHLESLEQAVCSFKGYKLAFQNHIYQHRNT